MNKTSLALAASVAAHLALAVFVFSTATRLGPPPVVEAPKIATRVSLFPRPVERSVARAEAPQRHFVRAAAAPSIAAAPTGVEAVPVAESGSGCVEADIPSAGDAIVAVPTPAAVVRTFDVAALHSALAASAKRCYPAAAKRFSLTGTVTVDFCLDANGSLTSTSLEGTSGQALLDAAARECVVKGALPLPADAFGACYAVPVRFGGN